MSRSIPNACTALCIAAILACSGGQPADDGNVAATVSSDEAPASVRLYVFDCGNLRIADPGRFSLTMDEVSTLELSVPLLPDRAPGRHAALGCRAVGQPG